MVMTLYDINNPELFKRRTQIAKANGYVWATDFPNHEPTYDEAKSWYHGNSKLLLHLFYNSILNRLEMSVTTKAVIKTFPQYKGIRMEVL